MCVCVWKEGHWLRGFQQIENKMIGRDRHLYIGIYKSDSQPSRTEESDRTGMFGVEQLPYEWTRGYLSMRRSKIFW